MADKEFPFLKFHRQLPREVPVAIRVLGYREIHGEFVEGDAAVAHELEPFRNAVVQRAAPRAVRIATVDAARSLLGDLLAGERGVDLAIAEHAHRHVELARQLAGKAQKWKIIFFHFD